MISIFEIVALLVTLSALFGWLNLRLFNLPHTIGLLVMGVGSSLLMLLIHSIAPTLGVLDAITHAVRSIDFYSTIMNGMLAFLLFAGALHFDVNSLRNEKWAIALMATIGVLISTVVTGGGLWLAASFFGFDLPLPWALVFGALISPTDPVAVLSLLKTVKVPESIKAKIAGESLFNDGVAVVAFTVLVAIALGMSNGEAMNISALHIAEVLVYEAGGGIIFGLVAGWIACKAMAAVDDHIVEILISLATCVATYALCHRFHMSGPIAVVVAGLMIGSLGASTAMSEKVEEYLFSFWEVVDEILNSVLFLLIGLEVLVIHFEASHTAIILAALPIALVGRFISVSGPIVFLSFLRSFPSGSIPILTWGGLRGGVSVALALSLPDSAAKSTILAATYAIVVFSIVVQGLTVRRVVERWTGPEAS